MRESKAKQSIIKTAQKLIEKKGYTNLNVNDVAYGAKVSVGTLYYHFPKGKVDILAEIMSQKVEGYVGVFNQQIGIEEILAKDMNLEDTIRWFFKKIIEFRRTDRPFLAALQSEMFSNPEDYMELTKKYQSTDGLQQAMGLLSQAVMEKAKIESISLEEVGDRQDMILRVVGLMMIYQIIFPGYFGSDDEFIDLAIGLFLTMLKS
ncbi:MAG: TetR/AcrR family transcriptional regulator [Candidatus Thorarchaeota archaeon]